MGRWLAVRLPGPQHWILHDHDPALLDLRRSTGCLATAADGRPVTVTTERGDITGLTAARPRRHLAGHRLRAAGPADPRRDGRPRRGLRRGRVPGPAGAVRHRPGRTHPVRPARRRDRRRVQRPPAPSDRGAGCSVRTRSPPPPRRSSGAGPTVLTQSSPWRLGGPEAALTAQWLRGWVGAAVEQRPDLALRADRLPAAAPGGLRGGRAERRGAPHRSAGATAAGRPGPADEPVPLGVAQGPRRHGDPRVLLWRLGPAPSWTGCAGSTRPTLSRRPRPRPADHGGQRLALVPGGPRARPAAAARPAPSPTTTARCS